MWLTILSDQLPVKALVSRYLANKLMGRGSLPERQVPKDPYLQSIHHAADDHICISSAFAGLSPTQGQVTHVFLTLSPLSTTGSRPKT